MRLILALLLSATVANVQAMDLTSPQVKPGQPLDAAQVFNGFGCKGGDVSPALTWSHAPAGTRSFAITAYDPDAPTGSGWWHWVVFDIPAHVHSLPTDAGNPARHLLPTGAREGRNDFGQHAYGGACPPAGAAPHRYVFTVYALNTDTLPVPADASAAMIGFMIHTHLLGKTTLSAKYGR